MDIGMHAHTVRWEPSIRGAAPSEGPMMTNYDVGPLKGHKKSAKPETRLPGRGEIKPRSRGPVDDGYLVRERSAQPAGRASAVWDHYWLAQSSGPASAVNAGSAASHTPYRRG